MKCVQAGLVHVENADRTKKTIAESRQPSIVEMVTGALAHLEATNKAYCLVVEGSRIDHGKSLPLH